MKHWHFAWLWCPTIMNFPHEYATASPGNIYTLRRAALHTKQYLVVSTKNSLKKGSFQPELCTQPLPAVRQPWTNKVKHGITDSVGQSDRAAKLADTHYDGISRVGTVELVQNLFNAPYTLRENSSRLFQSFIKSLLFTSEVWSLSATLSAWKREAFSLQWITISPVARCLNVKSWKTTWCIEKAS